MDDSGATIILLIVGLLIPGVLLLVNKLVRLVNESVETSRLASLHEINTN